MLPKPNRLPSPDIRSLLRKGKRIHSPAIQCIYGDNTLPVSRFAFIVSTKIDKRATARNRIKRLLREAVRNFLPDIVAGRDCIFIAKKNIAGLTQPEANIIVTGVLKQGNML